MSSDLRCRYDIDTKVAAANLFAQGYGRASAASALGISEDAVRKWLYTYRAVGLEGLLLMGSKQVKYTWEQKREAARAVVDGGMSVPDAMAAFGIASKSPLANWCRAYREGGEEALKPKPKGRPRGSARKPKELTREQELEVRVRKLEAENAYLKKLAALRAEETLRTGSKPRR